MAGNSPPENAVENSVVATTRLLKPVTVEVPIVVCQSSDESVSGSDEVVIQREGCQATFGQLSVKKDVNDIRIFVANPDVPLTANASCEFIQYSVPIHNESRHTQHGQPKCILLESQLKSLEKHFLHWSISRDSGPTVTFQLLNYESDVPHVNVKDESDQKFMWVFPLEESPRVSLKAYGQPFYLAFDCNSKPILCEGDPLSVQKYNVLKFTSP